VAIVSATAQLDVLDRRLAAGRARYDVVELDEAPFAAAMPVDGDERASSAVFHVDLAPDIGGDVVGLLRLSATATRVRSRGEFPAHQLVDERRQRPIEHLCEIAAGNGMAEQVLCTPQFLARFLRRREADFVPFRRDGAYRGPRRSGDATNHGFAGDRPTDLGRRRRQRCHDRAHSGNGHRNRRRSSY